MIEIYLYPRKIFTLGAASRLESSCRLVSNSSSSHQNQTKSLSLDQRAVIIRQCVEQQISPVELSRRYSVNADTIRGWVRKSGFTLPKTYRKTAASSVVDTNPAATAAAPQQRMMSTSPPLGGPPGGHG